MTEEKSSSNLIILGIAALAAMFFAYLIYSSNKQQVQPQLPQSDTLKANQLQEQIIEIQKIQLQQANNIIELENNKCATTVTIPPAQPVTQPTQTQDEFTPGSDMLSSYNTVSMPTQRRISNVNFSNVTRENEEIIAHRYFGMA